MAGMINYNDEYKLGTIEENTSVGIYGTLTNLPQELQDAQKLPVTYKEGIKKGKAQIISSVEGSRKAYDIEIEGTNYHSDGNNKGIQFQVTDEKLLKDTGGIVQGMLVRYNRSNTGNLDFKGFYGVCSFFIDQKQDRN